MNAWKIQVEGYGTRIHRFICSCVLLSTNEKKSILRCPQILKLGQIRLKLCLVATAPDIRVCPGGEGGEILNSDWSIQKRRDLSTGVRRSVGSCYQSFREAALWALLSEICFSGIFFFFPCNRKKIENRFVSDVGRQSVVDVYLGIQICFLGHSVGATPKIADFKAIGCQSWTMFQKVPRPSRRGWPGFDLIFPVKCRQVSFLSADGYSS